MSSGIVVSIENYKMNDKKNILLVEDNIIAAKIARVLLEKLGCEIDWVDDGDKAINMALTNHYDGICMDIGLVNVSGVEACKAIRAYESQNQLKHVPIIALTANNSPEEVTEYLKAGMQEVISKPLTKEKAEHFLSLCH